MSIVARRWEAGLDHHPQSKALVTALRRIDLDDELELELKVGHAGDDGEALMYLLDEMIERGMLSIEVRGVQVHHERDEALRRVTELEAQISNLQNIISQLKDYLRDANYDPLTYQERD